MLSRVGRTVNDVRDGIDGERNDSTFRIVVCGNAMEDGFLFENVQSFGQMRLNGVIIANRSPLA